VHARQLLEKALDEMNALHLRLRDRNWAEFSQYSFANELEECIHSLRDISKRLSELDKKLGKPLREELNFAPLLKDFEKLDGFLKRNLQMERKKESRIREVHFREQAEKPELYAALQQKALSILVRTRFQLERTAIALKRERVEEKLEEGSAEKNLMKLLASKESELQDLREKFNEMKKKTFMGVIRDEVAADLEKDLLDLGRKMDSDKKEIEALWDHYRGKFQGLQQEFMDLRERLHLMSGTYEEYVDKVGELNALLKKERDYAKKTVLDMENDLLKMRNKYSLEMMGLEESKAAARKKAEEKLGKHARKLEKDLESRDKIIEHLKEMLKQREKEIESIDRRRIALKMLLDARKAGGKKRKSGKGKKRGKKKKTE